MDRGNNTGESDDKSGIFDIDNTLYSYDRGNEAGMKALTVYGETVLQMDRETFVKVFRQAQQLVKERTGADCAAVHNRLIRMQCILELLGKPLFPHATVMYHYIGTVFYLLPVLKRGFCS